MFPTDFADLGYFPLRDERVDVPVSKRMMLAGGAVLRMVDPSFNPRPQDAEVNWARDNDMGTVGDIHPWFFWQTKNRQDRGMGSWAMSFAAISVDGARGGVSGRGGSTTPVSDTIYNPIRFDNYELDGRYERKPISWPKCFPNVPRGALVSVHAGTHEHAQAEIGLWGDPRLFAVNTAQPAEAGTLVVDLQPDAEPCMDDAEKPGIGGRAARLQSIFRVIPFEDSGGYNGPTTQGSGNAGNLLKKGDGNSIALNFTTSRFDKLVGYGMFYANLDQGAPDPRRRGSGTGRTVSTGPPGDRSTSTGSGSPSRGTKSDGSDEDPTSVCQFGKFEAEPRGAKGVGFLAHEGAFGPITAGHTDDKHRAGEDRDGHAMNSGHLSTEAFWYKDQTRDAPLKFEGDWPDEVADLKFPILCHIDYDDEEEHEGLGGKKRGMWKIWASSASFEPPPPPVIPPPTTPPGDPPPPPTTPPGSPPGTPTTPPGGPPGGPTTPPADPPVGKTPPYYDIIWPSLSPGVDDVDEDEGSSRPSRPSPSGPGGPITPGGGGGGGGGDGSTPGKGGSDPREGEGDGTPSGGDEEECRNSPTTRVSVGETQVGDYANYVGAHHPFMESFASVSWRPQMWMRGLMNFEHNPDLEPYAYYDDERYKPQVMTMRPWGAQTASGEWDYSIRPDLSRARGGVSDGGLLVAPPEFEMEDYFQINSAQDVETTSSTSTFLLAPGTQLGFGQPATDGGLANGTVYVDRDLTVSDKPLRIRVIDSGGNVRELARLGWDSTNGSPLAKFPGTGALAIPIGTSAQEPSSPADGSIRIVSSGAGIDKFAYYDSFNGDWRTIETAVEEIENAVIVNEWTFQASGLSDTATTFRNTSTGEHNLDLDGEVIFDRGTYTGILKADTLTKGQTWTLPNSTGTLAVSGEALPIDGSGAMTGNLASSTVGTFTIQAATGSIDIDAGVDLSLEGGQVTITSQTSSDIQLVPSGKAHVQGDAEIDGDLQLDGALYLPSAGTAHSTPSAGYIEHEDGELWIYTNSLWLSVSETMLRVSLTGNSHTGTKNLKAAGFADLRWSPFANGNFDLVLWDAMASVYGGTVTSTDFNIYTGASTLIDTITVTAHTTKFHSSATPIQISAGTNIWAQLDAGTDSVNFPVLYMTFRKVRP